MCSSTSLRDAGICRTPERCLGHFWVLIFFRPNTQTAPLLSLVYFYLYEIPHVSSSPFSPILSPTDYPNQRFSLHSLRVVTFSDKIKSQTLYVPLSPLCGTGGTFVTYRLTAVDRSQSVRPQPPIFIQTVYVHVYQMSSLRSEDQGSRRESICDI